MKLSVSDEIFPHVIASLITAVVMLCLGGLMFWKISQQSALGEEIGLRITFIDRKPAINAIAQPPRLTGVRADAAQRLPRISNMVAVPPRDAPLRTPNSLSEHLFTSLGEVKLPLGVAIDPLKPIARPPGTPDERALKAIKRLVEEPKAVSNGQTLFDKNWDSSGTLGDLALKKLGRTLGRLQGLSKLVVGEDQPAKARPPPDFPFKPALHEQPSDLATLPIGETKESAPMIFEKIPGLKGEASQRIRTKLDAYERQFSNCDQKRVKDLLNAVRVQLTKLEQTELASTHGAGPIQAEETLFWLADSAYGQARHGLWFAEHELTACASPG